MEAFFTTNYAILASVSGQAFFVVGLLAAWEFRRYSQLPLARPLWMLAAFGLLYALAEWGRVFVPIQERYLPPSVTDTLWLVRVLLMAAAFGALLQFGIELLPPRSRMRLRAAPPVLFAIWIGLCIGGGGTLGDLDAAIVIAEIQARLILALPAGLIGALGLWIQERYLRAIGGPKLSRWVRVSSVSLALSGLALGMMLPGLGIWPGTHWLLGTPAELWRGLAGALFVLGMARTLAVFQLEQDRLVEEAERRAIVAQARERLAHELSDGVIQRLYAVGLLLEAPASQLPPNDPVHAALRELDVSIAELRAMLLEAQANPQPEARERSFAAAATATTTAGELNGRG